MIEREFFTYLHRRSDSGAVFYVGKGTAKRGRCERAYERSNRSKWWRNVAEKHGVTIEIVARFGNEEEAHSHERSLIAQYGRKNLVNLTDGGEGCCGINPSPEARAKLSAAAKRPRSAAWIKSIRTARKNGGNGGVVRRGDKLPESWRTAISIGQSGPNNYMRGKTGAAHPNSRKVRDRTTGTTYDSVQIAADALGHKMKTLYNWLSGHRQNPTSLEFA